MIAITPNALTQRGVLLLFVKIIVFTSPKLGVRRGDILAEVGKGFAKLANFQRR
jgi:hypothetical protein